MTNTFYDPNIEYYDNGYLTEESVEKLRKEQYTIKAIAAYEFALPIAAIQKWHLGFLQDTTWKVTSGENENGVSFCPKSVEHKLF
ncbi:MAG: hypothetical protein QNJ72_34020 [Pleurocapsa sp. MO_226.B13]|nr:hypothetical protein [Pleurocapsa sp. MO_226.B13]